MCIQSHHSEDFNGNYNQFVLDNVYNPSGYTCPCECPSCGKEAKTRDFDTLTGGCINSHTSINCSHCGYHECDNEFCSTCEAEAEARYEESETLYKEVYGLLEFYEEALASGTEFSEKNIETLKANILKHGLSLSLITDVENSQYVRNERFKRSLDAKIEHHKQELDLMVLAALDKINNPNLNNPS